MRKPARAPRSGAFFERVRQAYLERALSDSRYRIVDAGQPLEQVQADLAAQLQQLWQEQV